jgi:predicted phage baseplate assembly protein
MPLPLTTLDTRTFDQLVDEGHSIIPGSAPLWTDFNWHDPGITLIDLFAWLVEQDIYRLDRTTDASYRSFLRLVGVRPHPPQVADTILPFALRNPSPVTSAILPAGVQVGNAVGSIVFETAEGLNVSAANLVAVLSGSDLALVDHSNEIQALDQLYPPFGPNPAPGNSLYLGFDRTLADQPFEVSLYCWAGEAEADKEVRARLIAEWNSAKEEAEELCPRETVPDVPDWRLHFSARTIWEYYAQPGGWAPVTGLVDETRALTLSGPVRFMAPQNNQQMPGGVNGAQYAGYYFIRCRLTGGGYECSPRIQGIALNTVNTRHAAEIAASEVLPDSNGRARQTFRLQQKPVVPASTQVQVTTNQGVEAWHEEIVWDQVGPHSKAYVLSPEAVQITFGDGRIGRVPPDGAGITATYRVGGGAAGNVPARTLTAPLTNLHNSNLVASWNVLQPILQIGQPLAASGGADAESMSGAMKRAFVSLSQPRRGVTLKDFESLALATPGVPIARAYAISNYDPAFPCFPALGTVTVVVLPQCPDAQPQPSPGFLKAVQRYVDRRRTITTEVHVIGPSYTVVSVKAHLNVQLGVNSQTIAQLAQAALADFLNPLRGGPDKSGWPAGRGVYRAEIFSLLNSFSGVVFVDELTLQADQGPAISCDNLSICRHGFVASGQHHITINVWRGNR